MLELFLAIAIYSLWVSLFIGTIGLLGIRIWFVLQFKPASQAGWKILLLPFSIGLSPYLNEKSFLVKVYTVCIWVYGVGAFLGSLLLFYNLFL